MRVAEYTGFAIVERVDRANKSRHDRSDKGLLLSPPAEESPAQHYSYVKFPWASDPVKCNLRSLKIARTETAILGICQG